MPSFSEQHDPDYPPVSGWIILQGKYKGRPMLVRRNDSAKAIRKHPLYGHRVGVAIPLLNPDERGFPSNDEAEVLNRIEDALSLAFEDDQASLEVLVITTNPIREYIYYTRTPSQIEAKLAMVAKQFPDHQLQSYVTPDPNWEVYDHFN
jgi:hypothetical protein